MFHFLTKVDKDSLQINLSKWIFNNWTEQDREMFIEQQSIRFIFKLQGRILLNIREDRETFAHIWLGTDFCSKLYHFNIITDNIIGGTRVSFSEKLKLIIWMVFKSKSLTEKKFILIKVSITFHFWEKIDYYMSLVHFIRICE